MPTALTLTTTTPDQTRVVGAALGRLVPPRTVILLHGDLGAGKTTLAQGIAQGLGVPGPVQSPTFTLANEHDGIRDGAPIRLYHLDLYRLAGEGDLDGVGWDAYLAAADGVTVVEWPERAGSALPEAYWLVRLEDTGDGGRRLTFSEVPSVARSAPWLATLASEVAGFPARRSDSEG
ncbi:MAG: tRNA threonylcarbamoyladenosine biosynthesis protein TsaE [uncultured Thermomicrobiales bacterium]|uniref:tRNA threonylcarbamoyladenosine biosynthesis protein TsaE n=1 Tax=uncultured Thermomicrobiales bacterium TaxID=1645740 RepID=A0A6J4UGR8_9BACT|nr:MAG: tRNA threonylcarbamoyladenosine biosynthesis protein TsaE [uncultured Thermomicrobiales bacterium]